MEVLEMHVVKIKIGDIEQNLPTYYHLENPEEREEFIKEWLTEYLNRPVKEKNFRRGKIVDYILELEWI